MLMLNGSFEDVCSHSCYAEGGVMTWVSVWEIGRYVLITSCCTCWPEVCCDDFSADWVADYVGGVNGVVGVTSSYD